MKKYFEFKGRKIFPLGLGTWGIGGFANRDPENDDAGQLAAITYALQHGVNYMELSTTSADGHSARLVFEAIKASGVKREDLFLCFCMTSGNAPKIEDQYTKLKSFMEQLGSNYVDSIELQPQIISLYGKDAVINIVKEQLELGRTHFVNYTNGSLDQLKDLHNIFGDKFFSHEVCVNFEIRENEDLGIIAYANENEIFNVTYQPLRRNRTANRNWPLLIELAKKYNKTQNQIILNWLATKGIGFLVKSGSVEHVKENLAALEFEMDKQDFERINTFRPIGWQAPKIDWTRSGDGKAEGDGIYVDQLSNVFDEEYTRLNQ